MRLLLAFGTTEGQTRKIASHIASALRENGHNVDVRNCATDPPRVDMTAVDAVIVAASVHQARYQPAIYRFVAANDKPLREIPSAFVSVSLSKTFTEGMDLAHQYYNDFVEETGWRSDLVHHTEGAIRYSEYDFFKVQTIEHVVFKGKKNMPPRSGNPEFTNWEALDRFVSEFVAHAEMVLKETPFS